MYYYYNVSVIVWVWGRLLIPVKSRHLVHSQSAMVLYRVEYTMYCMLFYFVSVSSGAPVFMILKSW